MKFMSILLCTFLFLSMNVALPANRNSSSENKVKVGLEKPNSERIRYLKKSVYNYLESKLESLNSSQQELLAKKLIAKLNRHFSSRRRHQQSHGPWTDNGEIFARMLKWKWELNQFSSIIFLSKFWMVPIEEKESQIVGRKERRLIFWILWL